MPSTFDELEEWFVGQLSKGAAKTYRDLAKFTNQGARYEIMKKLAKDFGINLPKIF